MTVSVDVANARYMARELEKHEADRHGVNLGVARNSIAQRCSASPGTLENLSRDRLKKVSSDFHRKIREAFIAKIFTDIRKAEFEINLALQAGDDPRGASLVAAQAQIQAALALLK